MTNEDLNAISALLDAKFDSMKNELSKEMDSKLDSIRKEMNEHFEKVDEQLQDIDSAIGMLADWADNVGVITRVPFASGQK